jgi:hypothetical protein
MKFSEKNYDVIFILSGGLKKDGNVWRTNKFNEGDNFGATGDTIRVIAGSYLFNHRLAPYIIASGGKGQYKDIADAPTVASVMNRELIALGIPADKIEIEDQSGSTYQQLNTLVVWAKQKRWKSVAVISNEWHLPRIKAMIEHKQEINDCKNTVELISAESVLLAYEPKKWQKIIEDAYKSAGIKKRIAVEQQGIADIKNNKYKY